ncbi:MAG: hypothetical protein ACI4PO_06580 [Faecousia sp.]
MKLKHNINLETFFEQVHQCQGEVTFQSQENDVLNLKSRLCLYLFSVSYAGNGPQLAGKIVCQIPEDEELLAEFLEEEEL